MPEHALDPRVTMRRVTAHVERCHRCRSARRELPAATELIASVPAEQEPRELRDDALERVDLVLRDARDDPPSGRAEGDDPVGYGTLALVDEDEDADASSTSSTRPSTTMTTTGRELAAAATTTQSLELTPPPVPLGRSGFPQSLFPGTPAARDRPGGARRRVWWRWRWRSTGAAAVPCGSPPCSAEVGKPAATTPATATVPPATVPVETTPADATVPSVTSLARRFGCIGPTNPTTDVLATVTDDGAIASVDVIISTTCSALPASGCSRRAGSTVAEIGPYSDDGTISWTVEATDQDGNLGTNTGRTVGVSQSC